MPPCLAHAAFHAMGTDVSISVDSTDAAARARLGKAARWFAAWERRLSRFGACGELARLNRGVEPRARVSRTLASALRPLSPQRDGQTAWSRRRSTTPSFARGTIRRSSGGGRGVDAGGAERGLGVGPR